MPELPDITLYVESLAARLVGKPLVKLRLGSPFLLRTAVPPIADFHGQRVLGVERLGKRIVFVFEGERLLVLHLMIAGRLRWRPPGEKLPGKLGLAAFDFPDGTLLLTEAGSKRRASLHAVLGRAGLAAFDRGGLSVLQCTDEEFARRVRRTNHTLKRALTDPTILDGIGNAYSDEILWEAQLSPVRLTDKLDDAACARLRRACQTTLLRFTEAMRRELGGEFPEKVTAFRDDMAVHGRFGKPCPRCQTKVQRIRYADNETNYCPTCQTDGKLLADRALSRLLGKDWPRSLDELEEHKASRRQ